MKLTWDEVKNAENQRKHGIDFNDLKPLFIAGLHTLSYDSENSSLDEDRYIATGTLPEMGVILVVFVEWIDDYIHIISARKQR